MYEYITQIVSYKKDEDLMKQLNDGAALGWEVLTVYPHFWEKSLVFSTQSTCAGVMVVYRRVLKPAGS